MILLPEVTRLTEVSLHETINTRKSERKYSDTPISIHQLSEILWAGLGTTSNGRSIPSAGAVYPLSLFVVIRCIENINPGLYRYDPDNHALLLHGNIPEKGLSAVCLNQKFIDHACGTLIFSASFERMILRYGSQAERYIYMEIGHSAQNIYLTATSLNLGTVAVGAFDERGLQLLLDLPIDEPPLYVMPIGQLT